MITPFEEKIKGSPLPVLEAVTIDTLQVNVGKLCNQICKHCHVDAGPKRTEIMTPETAALVAGVLRRHGQIKTLDITGGAPEMCPSFEYLVEEATQLGRHIIDRCNLTVFYEPGKSHLPDFLKDHRVEVVASMPCYLEENVDSQRGRGVFHKSVDALLWLNRLGYGLEGSGLELNLVYNPVGAYLPPPQAQLEADYKRELRERYGIVFNHLYTITNMPISRFKAFLEVSGQYDHYMQKLESAFNPATVPNVMCRSLISVSWDGYLYDCDFNQMLQMRVNHGLPNHIRDFDSHVLSKRRIATRNHCYGCTAGAGSSCGGVVVPNI